jgi:putative toxin-antitoxin system antitoxin component (TIGR02293 family)
MSQVTYYGFDRIMPIEQGDRAVRLIRIATLGPEIFADPDKLWRWMFSSKESLEGLSPMDMLLTEHGTREVENMMRRIKQGIAA